MADQGLKEGNLSETEIQEIGAYVMPNIPLEPAEIGIVFGSPHSLAPIISTTFELWAKGFIKYIVATGGVQSEHGTLECHAIEAGLLKLGVPKEVVFTESRSTNTGENVAFSAPVISSIVGRAQPESIIGVGKIFATRRCLMTMHKNFQNSKKMFEPVNTFGTPKESWYLHPVFRQKVLSEYQKIPKYLKMGFLSEIELSSKQ
jgi:uncharacterized SAM-binding protein YcdF (DUF218 family)